MRVRMESWFVCLLVVAVVLQAVTGIVRPLASYRALGIGVSPEFLGVLAAVWALVPLALAFSIGRLVDRHGEVVFMALGMAALTISTFLVAAAGSVAVLLLALALSGTANVVALVAIQTLTATSGSVAGYDRRFGYLATVGSLGQLIGPAIVGIVAANGSPQSIDRALITGGVMSAASMPMVAWIHRRQPAPETVEEPAAASSRPPLATILRTPGMLPAILAGLTVMSAIDILVVFLPALGEERGISVAVIGLLLAVRAGASMASRLIIGQLVDRFGRERLLVASMAISCGSIAALAFVPLPLMLVTMVVAGLGLGIGQPLTIAWVASSATPGTRATALSVRLMGNRLGQVVIPIAAGTAAAAAGAAGVLVATGLAVGASALVVGRRARRP